MAQSETITHSLELDEDIKLAEKSWPIQRIGWGLLFLFLVLSALGVCGTGILSKASERVDGHTLEYQRFARIQNQIEMRFKLSNVQRNAVIVLPQSYISNVEIRNISPEPTQQAVENGKHFFVFDGSGDMTITFYTEARKAGRYNTNIMAGHTRFSISQLIYP